MAIHSQTTQFSGISQLVCVSESSVRCYITQFQEAGDVQPTSHRHGPRKLLGEFGQLGLLRLILESLGIYLHEVQANFLALFGVTVSSATICRTLNLMGCTRQVIQHIPVQRNDELRAKFRAEISVYDTSMLIWIDESGCNRRHSTRKWRYSLGACLQEIIGCYFVEHDTQPFLWCH